MKIRFDWSQIYVDLVSDSARPQKSAFAAARQIEHDIFKEGWPAGEIFGAQSDLISRYGFSRATLREAVRLLEDRQVARMRRGPGGGLVVLPVCGGVIAPPVAEYFRKIGVTKLQLQQARAALAIVAAYRQSLTEGEAAVAAFRNEFRGRLAGPGAGLLSAGASACSAVRTVGSDPVTDLFAACLDALENRMFTQDGTNDGRARVDGAHGVERLMKGGRAHELAHKLALELPPARADAARRVSTEDQLCERHNVGRDVLRQAIRVLESRGLIDCRRGRTHGVHAGPSDTAAYVELVVGYFSSIRLRWEDFFPVACIISRIVRLVVAAESTRAQRQALLRRLDCARSWADAPTLITRQLQAEWSCVANPILIFMERCSTAYYARASAAVWTSFDDSELHRLHEQVSYMEAVARGNLVQADSIVESVCAHVSMLRSVDARSVSRGTFKGHERYAGILQ